LDVEVLGIIDQAAAGARLSDALKSSAPALTDAEHDSFDLKALRHPLLVLQTLARAAQDPSKRAAQVVANDVSLPGSARALIISGPNAGGKTVTITAVGLAAL